MSTSAWMPVNESASGWTPVDEPAAPQDTRNSVQKFLDSSVTPPTGTKMDNSAEGIFNQAYYGVPQGMEHVVAHPLDTLAGIGHTLAHLKDSGTQMVQNFAKQPVLATGQLLGATAAMQPVADLAVAGLGQVPGVVGRAALLGKTPEAAYESALKPSTTIPAAQRASIVQTGLSEGIPISKGGIEKLGTRIDQLNQAIKDQIAADPTRQISPVPALQNLKAVRAKFANQVNPTADVSAVNAAGNEFADRFGPNGEYPQGTMPADAAQDMKQGTYRALGNKAYGELKGASIEAQKSLARGLKDEIATQFPEIGNLNAQESKLLDLEPVLERAVNRTANHQLIGIGSPIAGTAIKATTGSTSAGAVAMALKSVLDNPMVKSRLAIAVSKGQNIPFSQALGRVQAYSTALGSTAGASQVGNPGDTPNQ